MPFNRCSKLVNYESENYYEIKKISLKYKSSLNVCFVEKIIKE